MFKVMQMALPRFKLSVVTPRRVRIPPPHTLSSPLSPPQKPEVRKGPTPRFTEGPAHDAHTPGSQSRIQPQNPGISLTRDAVSETVTLSFSQALKVLYVTTM